MEKNSTLQKMFRYLLLPKYVYSIYALGIGIFKIVNPAITVIKYLLYAKLDAKVQVRFHGA